MLEVGRVEAPIPGAFFSWNRAHFGGWCIVSSPLILGLELTDHELGPVLDILGNVEAIAINQVLIFVAQFTHKIKNVCL